MLSQSQNTLNSLIPVQPDAQKFPIFLSLSLQSVVADHSTYASSQTYTPLRGSGPTCTSEFRWPGGCLSMARAKALHL